VNGAMASQQISTTIFGCRCCDACIGGTTDGRFGYDDRGSWKRIANIDGPDAICPACQADPASLDALKEDGYDNAAIV